MAASATRGKRIGDVLIWEVDNGEHGFCRTAMSVTVEDDIAVGSVVAYNGAWINGNNSEGGNAVGVVIDERIYDAADGANTLVVLTKGPAIVRLNSLSFDGTAITADYTAAAAALLALGIKCE